MTRLLSFVWKWILLLSLLGSTQELGAVSHHPIGEAPAGQSPSLHSQSPTQSLSQLGPILVFVLLTLLGLFIFFLGMVIPYSIGGLFAFSVGLGLLFLNLFLALLVGFLVWRFIWWVIQKIRERRDPKGGDPIRNITSHVVTTILIGLYLLPIGLVTTGLFLWLFSPALVGVTIGLGISFLAGTLGWLGLFFLSIPYFSTVKESHHPG